MIRRHPQGRLLHFSFNEVQGCDIWGEFPRNSGGPLIVEFEEGREIQVEVMHEELACLRAGEFMQATRREVVIDLPIHFNPASNIGQLMASLRDRQFGREEFDVPVVHRLRDHADSSRLRERLDGEQLVLVEDTLREVDPTLEEP